MSDPTQREWHFYLDDMIGFGEKVIVYTDGLDQADFVASADCVTMPPCAIWS